MRASPWSAKVGLVLVFGALVTKAFSLFLQILIDRRFFPSLTLGDGFVSFTSGLATTANIAVAVSVIVAAVLFIRWFSETYNSLAEIDAAVHPPHWALLGWFVPGLNLIRPPQIMGELTNQFSAGRRPKRARWTRQLWLWWGLAVAGVVIHILLRVDLPNTRRGWFYWESVALLATILLLISIAACWGLVDRAALKQAGIHETPPRLRKRSSSDDESLVPETASAETSH